MEVHHLGWSCELCQLPVGPNNATYVWSIKKVISYDECQVVGDNPDMAIWARAYEKAQRLALVYACSADRDNPAITPE